MMHGFVGAGFALFSKHALLLRFSIVYTLNLNYVSPILFNYVLRNLLLFYIRLSLKLNRNFNTCCARKKLNKT